MARRCEYKPHSLQTCLQLSLLFGLCFARIKAMSDNYVANHIPVYSLERRTNRALSEDDGVTEEAQKSFERGADRQLKSQGEVVTGFGISQEGLGEVPLEEIVPKYTPKTYAKTWRCLNIAIDALLRTWSKDGAKIAKRVEWGNNYERQNEEWRKHKDKESVECRLTPNSWRKTRQLVEELFHQCPRACWSSRMRESRANEGRTEANDLNYEHTMRTTKQRRNARKYVWRSKVVIALLRVPLVVIGVEMQMALDNDGFAYN
ncbi:unnamed protein product [Protopolystoma xenopodis]|uniref:Uncharacterized protein n=1 Tax=Protopolystoma xenopodis TaxID=117903 RepID=A0A3S5C5Y2_9PLAT|nr:unnamed protein product [Protopolystoma xenopodis]